MRKYFFFVMILLGAAWLSSAYGQQNARKEAVGYGYSPDLRVAQQEAIRNAKLNAITNSGVRERIISETHIFTTGEGEKLLSYPTGVDLLMQEATVEYKREDMSLSFTIVDGNDVKATAVIRNAKVWAEEWDPYFTFSITGLPLSRKEDSKFSFQVTPTQDCYIRIFFFDISGVTNRTDMLFPYKAFNDMKVEARQTFMFPPMDSKFCKGQKYELKLEKDDQIKDVENIALLVVAVKDEARTPDDLSWEGVIKWLHSIPSKQRTYQVRQISIEKKQD